MQWERLDNAGQANNIVCKACGYGTTTCYKSERDEMTWGAPVQKQTRKCKKCGTLRHMYYFIVEQ